MEKNKKTRHQKVKELMSRLEKGVREVMESELFKAHLEFIASFHRYSYYNTLSIFLHNPDATLVKGMKQWNKHGRKVKKGEKGIPILAPIQIEVKKEKKDEQGNVVRDENGNVVYETVKINTFKTVYVFDVSQTEGKELPKPPIEAIRGSSAEAERLYQVLKSLIPIPVREGDTGTAHGYYDLIKNEIVISHRNERNHQLKTLIHEYAHYLLHRKGAQFEKESREIKEAQAESIAYVVGKYFGLNTDGYSFGYVAAWAKHETEVIRQIMEEVQQFSGFIIDQIEKAVADHQQTAAQKN